MGTKEEIDRIEKQISSLYDKLYEKRPSHFHKRDIVNAFFASFVLGLVFLFKGSLVEISLNLTNNNLFAIVFVTIVILSFEIYYVGYTRVSPSEKKNRKFGQFWLKRILTLYSISIIVPLVIVYLFGINSLVSNGGIFRIIIAVSMPCAIGAAVPSLLKQY